MDKTGLKPCPFCGNEYPLLGYEHMIDVVKICCPHCQIEFLPEIIFGYQKDKEKLIKAWNRRADNG